MTDYKKLWDEVIDMNEQDNVKEPEHYKKNVFEVIDFIELVLDKWGDSMTPFQHYCAGNSIKYRMRAGYKGEDANEDIAKAKVYEEWLKNGR